MITGINHVATLTSDMDLTVGFYESVFGATVVHEIGPSDGHPWMKIVELGGGASLNVFEVPSEDIVGERERIGGRGAIDHFGIGVDSLAAIEGLRTRLVDSAAREVGQIQQLGAEWSLFFRDPDGMDLEICAPVSS